MTTSDHCGMGGRWKVGDDLVTAGDLRRNNRHDGSREERVSTAGDVAAHCLNRYDAVTEVKAWEALDFERKDRSQLRLSKAADVRDSELGIFTGLRVKIGDGPQLLFLSNFEVGDLSVIEGEGVISRTAASPRWRTFAIVSLTVFSSGAMSKMASRAGCLMWMDLLFSATRRGIMKTSSWIIGQDRATRSRSAIPSDP